MRRLDFLASWLVVSVALFGASRSAATQPAAARPVIRIVDGATAAGVRFEGEPWTIGKHCLVGSGRGNALLATGEIGAGDFTIRIWLRIRGLAGSGAAVRFGDNRFGFAPVFGGSACFVKGSLFHPGRRLGSPVPGSENAVVENRTFAFEAQRSGSTLTFRIDGRDAYRLNAGAGVLGALGVEPRRATVSLYRFEVIGNLIERGGLDRRAGERARRDELQKRIDEAIDRGARCLLDRQQRDGSWSHCEDSFPSGQTALSVFTLLKAGVPPAHPGIRRGLANLHSIRPRTTYVAACHLMALGATGDEAHHPRMKLIVKDLVSWRTDGAWGYPYHPTQQRGGEPGGPAGRARRGGGPGVGWVDLSNTQYAALGLRAARLAGLEIPREVWTSLAEAVLRFQTDEERVAVAPAAGESRTYRMPARGFAYNQRQRQPTGSMTTAGVSILAICREALGTRKGRGFSRAWQHAIDRGLNWLVAHFSVRENPGNPTWLYYYLYGLERVGSILGMERIGGHRWYHEGAVFLLDHQDVFGAWVGQGVEASTCFAILFLRRASQATVRRTERRSDRFVADGPEYRVGLRGIGRWPLRVWVSGFRDDVFERHGIEVEGKKHLRVARVDYLADGVVIGSKRGEPRRPWVDENFMVTHHFTRPGHHQVTARVHLVAPGVPMGRSEPTVTVEAPGFSVRVDEGFESWMKPLAEAWARNRLRGRDIRVQVSSRYSARQGGKRAVDFRESTWWLCRRDDASPAITLTWPRALKADRIWLSPAGGSRIHAGAFDRIREIEVRLSRRSRPIRIEVEPDPIRPIEVKLPSPTALRRLTVTITRRDGHGPRPGRAGFSEIYLTRD